jgi:hypothetical protein
VKPIILDLALIAATPIVANAQTTAPPEPRSCQQLHEETNKCDAGMRSCDQRVLAWLEPQCDRDQKRLPQVRGRRAAVGAGLRWTYTSPTNKASAELDQIIDGDHYFLLPCITALREIRATLKRYPTAGGRAAPTDLPAAGRFSPVTPGSSEGPLTELTAGAQPWLRAGTPSRAQPNPRLVAFALTGVQNPLTTCLFPTNSDRNPRGSNATNWDLIALVLEPGTSVSSDTAHAGADGACSRAMRIRFSQTFDVLLAGAAVVIEGNDALGGSRRICEDHAELVCRACRATEPR